MEKRGQVTTFIIVGVVLLIVILLALFLREDVFVNISKVKNTDIYLKSQMNEIINEVNTCVDLEANKALKTLGDQGGYFTPRNYLSYYGYNIAYLCSEVKDEKTCRNNMLIEERLENDLNLYLKDRLKKCIDLRKFKEGFKLHDYELKYDLGAFDLKTDIEKKNVRFEIFLPIELISGDVKFSKDKFVKIVDIPFGEIIIIANDILNSEASIGDFETTSYNIFRLGKYDLDKRRVYPDKVYTIRVLGYNYRFQFAIEGAE